LLIGVGYAVFAYDQDHTSTTQKPPVSQSQSGFDKKQYSTSDPTSIWVVVNKKNALNPVSYKPSDLIVPSVTLRVPGNESMQVSKETANALEKMFGDAKNDGIKLMLASGYRSYTYQVNLYNGYVKTMGQAKADKTSARPGHSEHQQKV
jgi:D-alanyl-D-alanine carboxypeptidase